MNSRSSKLRDFIYSALFAALIIALGFIAVPIGPVPISGINLGVMLAGSVLPVRQAVYSILTVILLGAAGLPVFSGFTGGVGVLLGPRGGYYAGFLAGAAVTAALRGKNNSLLRLTAANIAGGILMEYLIAVPWLLFVTQMDVKQALTAGVLPFIPGDLIKTVLAAILAKTLYKNIPGLGRRNG